MSDTMVSVCMITYNHEAFLAQAIESVLSQITDFKFEIIISEDCSKDKTRDIVASYAAKYSDIIKPIYNVTNIGMQRNFGQCLEASGSKYVATLEGDDFWTDIHKLQKQVDFLEGNTDYSLCFSALDIVNNLGDKFYIPTPFMNFSSDTYTVEDIIAHPPDKPLSIPIMSLVYRNNIIHPLPDFFYHALAGDTALTMILGLKGKFKYMPEKMAAYRQHIGGITKSKEFLLKFDRAMFDLLDEFNEYTHHKYHQIIKTRLYEMSKTLLMYGSGLLKGNERQQHISRMLKGYRKYRPSVDVKEITYYYMVLFFPFLLKIHKRLFKK